MIFREKDRPTLAGYLIRFSLVHAATYLLFGVTFMLLSNYFDYP